MKGIIVLILSVVVLFFAFGAEEIPKEQPVKVAQAATSTFEVRKKEESFNCLYASRLYATKQDLFKNNDAAEKGHDAFDRCIDGTLTEEELTKAWELQRAAPKLKIKKEFITDQRKLAVHTTLG